MSYANMTEVEAYELLFVADVDRTPGDRIKILKAVWCDGYHWGWTDRADQP